MSRPRVLRVIARMNVGGPAHHVSILSGGLTGYETLLVAGRVGPGEASADYLAADRGAHLLAIDDLGPELRPAHDLRATLHLIRIIRRFRPDIVHTHTAKAGFLGRAAATVALRRRPIIVHTYHGHVLEGYFGRAQTALYRGLERLMARVSDVLLGVSVTTVDDLVRLGVAPAERFRALPLGLHLEPFAALPSRPAADDPLRLRLGVGPDDILVTVAGRLAPIKRLEVALEAFARARSTDDRLRLLIAGDGELRSDLEERARALGIAERVHFAGYVRDMPAVVAASDLALLTSDNEGTPVALIEASAGARPAVATDVGGVADVVPPGAGLLCAAGDAEGLAQAIVALARDDAARVACGERAREHVLGRYGRERLLADVDALYRELLASRRRR